MDPSVRNPVRRFHQGEGGAVLLLVLAGLLAILMMAWVVVDAGQAGRDKLRVQSAADNAAWSEAAVEARSMNMIAFANVAKRVTVGMTSYYQSLTIAYGRLLGAATTLTVACWLADILAGGALTPVCVKLSRFGTAVGQIVLQELPDTLIFEFDLNFRAFRNDVIALNNYQSYMSQLAPWWAYAEGIQRGMLNGAAVTASFPVPPNSFSNTARGVEVPGVVSLQTSGIVDTLPIMQMDDPLEAGLEMCQRVFSDVDIAGHTADYLAQSTLTNTGVYPELATFWVSILALQDIVWVCPAQTALYGQATYPWKLNEYDESARGKASWLTDTSNLTFAYRPSEDRMKKERNKFQIMGDKKLDLDLPIANKIYNSGGYWSMARSEISFQNGEPNLWHPAWAARMRPIAVVDEWANNGAHLGNALIDVLPVMVAGAAMEQVSSASVDLEGASYDLARIIMATQAYHNARSTKGITK